MIFKEEIRNTVEWEFRQLMGGKYRPGQLQITEYEDNKPVDIPRQAKHVLHAPMWIISNGGESFKHFDLYFDTLSYYIVWTEKGNPERGFEERISAVAVGLSGDPQVEYSQSTDAKSYLRLAVYSAITRMIHSNRLRSRKGVSVTLPNEQTSSSDVLAEDEGNESPF